MATELEAEYNKGYNKGYEAARQVELEAGFKTGYETCQRSNAEQHKNLKEELTNANTDLRKITCIIGMIITKL